MKQTSKTVRMVRLLVGAAVVAIGLTGTARANVTNNPFFREGAVLQQNANVTLWGTASSGEVVTVGLRGNTNVVTADGSGQWWATVPSGAAGGPFTLTVAGANTLTYTNILVGEVWIASGQSNIDPQYSAVSSLDADEVLEATNAPPNSNIRFYGGYGNGNAWISANPATVLPWSAVPYFFAKNLQARMNVPVGIYQAAVGGTPISYWMVGGTGYSNLIAPVASNTFRGVLWYQGESDSSADPSIAYRTNLATLVEGWRSSSTFNNPSLAFTVVQIAPQSSSEGSFDGRNGIWEAELLNVNKYGLGIVVTTDWGDANIHPTSKRALGYRAFLSSLGTAYGSNIVHSSPICRSIEISATNAILTFNNAANGLITQTLTNNPALYGNCYRVVPNTTNATALQGIRVITGANWVNGAASATITGNTVVVNASSISFVGYGNFSGGYDNLFNAEGLPAATFRSDDVLFSPLYLQAGAGGSVSTTNRLLVAKWLPIPISATPAAGYVFTNWTSLQGPVDIANPYSTNTTITVTNDGSIGDGSPRAIRANFRYYVDCRITTPTNVTVVNTGVDLTVSATATVLSGASTISKVQFLRGTNLLGESLTPPYTCTWSNAPAGKWKLTARAINSLGATGTSQSVFLQVATNGVRSGLCLSGGDVTYYTENKTNYIAHTFTNSGTLTAVSNGVVEYLVVGGGGGGGGTYESGGGGAGGVRLGAMTLSAGTYTITVGNGGNGSLQGGLPASNGGSSSLSNSLVAVKALGGGYGGSSRGDMGGGAAGDGGSGGGGMWGATAPGKAVGGVGELGHDGGLAYAASGGGGAGSVGQSASPYAGGSGIDLSFTGVPVTYAAGGFGRPRYSYAVPPYRNGFDGFPNTGQGAAAGSSGVGSGVGGTGGSGIVVVRYAFFVDDAVPEFPAAPTNLTAQPLSGSSIQLNWTDNATNETGYVVDRSTNAMDWVNAALPGVNATSCTDTGLVGATLYYYRVAASNGWGLSDYSTNSARTLTNGLPGTPTNFTATATSTDRIQLNWTDVATNETGYIIDRSPDGSTWSNLTTTLPNVTAYLDSGLSTGTLYYYRAAASNAIGLSGYAIASATTLSSLPDYSFKRRYRLNGTNYFAYIYTNTSSVSYLTLSGFSGATSVEYLVVAGGGGGGGTYEGGGGGAGGARFGRTNMTAGTPYTITVGAGGLGRGQGTPVDGTNGNPSSISGSDVAVSTTGGGRGGSSGGVARGLDGGSGGGGAYTVTYGTAIGGPGELGNNGGAGGNGVGNGAGGGGARSAGQSSPSTGGGSGTNLAFSGVSVTYCTGGNGAIRTGASGANNGTNGAVNTGNGGGGGGNTSGNATGGNGGSGIVILRYVDALAFSATLTVTSATAVWPFQPGAFTISRPADATTNAEMLVYYTLTGTATNGVDYAAAPATNNLNIVPLTGSVIFGVGVTSIVVNLYPLYNPLASARTATLTLDAAGNPAASVTLPAWDVGSQVTAVGGTVTNYPYGGGSNWIAHIFTNAAATTNFTITSGGQVEYLVVAGGGGGGGSPWSGGGGGAGGVRFGALTLPAGGYTITIGDGGLGSHSDGGSSGRPSILAGSNGIAVVKTTGGGRGASINICPSDTGGSGGGGVYGAPYQAGASAVGGGELGKNGGAGRSDVSWPGGGGGGASADGQTAPNGSTFGVGGSGTNLNHSGVLTEYAKGGNGSLNSGGLANGADGDARTGNGGTAGQQGGTGGKGGSGIVIVRYVQGLGGGGAGPYLQNAAASDVTTNSATLHGTLISTGSPSPNVYVLYGPNTNAWACTNEVIAPGGGWTNGAPAVAAVGGLTPDLTYYYTFAASNASPTNVVAVQPRSFITGPVTVQATAPQARWQISGSSNGQFTISRPAACANESLVVTYTMSGSASNGVDYGLLSGSATMPAGATSVVVTVSPLYDADPADEQAVLTLGTGDYPTGVFNSATVTILPAEAMPFPALGGSVRHCRENGTNYYAHIFTNSASNETFVLNRNLAVEYLVVAGGGGGGGGAFTGSGGGAGGVRLGSANMTASAYTITVGDGGAGCPINGGAPWSGTNGYPSSINGAGVTVNATGGGRGNTINMGGPGNGGSGGGGHYGVGAGSAVGGGELGNNGGYVNANPGCGGGGARTAGGASSGNNGGVGGGGTNLSFSGVPVVYASGGDGAPTIGGGWGTYFQGADGAPNTGNGGGGSCNANSTQTKNGGKGGSGIVIVRYADAGAFSATVTATSAAARWPFEVGAFTISRPADALTEMIVYYTLTGTATNGVDYAAAPATNNLNIAPLPGYVTFGVGVTSIVVNLYPLYNPSLSAKSATMTLAADGNPSAFVTFPAWSVGKAVTATGGTVTNYPIGGGSNWIAHIFTNVVGSTNFTLTTGGQVECLVVAGGGGGGGGPFAGAGGGAGGVRINALTLPAGSYTITVGDGGVGCPINGGSPVGGTNGSPSLIGGSSGIVVASATGGGRGASTTGGAPFYPGLSGGSGGGGAWSAYSDRGLAVGGGELGNNGGTFNGSATGGGGGARTVGGAAPNNSTAGVGGSGTNLNFSGVSVEYAKGGDGAPSWSYLQGANGADNTGNGGGGSANNNNTQTKNGGKGGSGIVIVRYVLPPPPKGTVILVW